MSIDVKGNIISSTDITSVGGFKSRVNRDGLISNIDAADKNSFPTQTSTTNIISDAIHMNNWAPYGYGNDGQFVTEFNTIGYKIINRGSWNGLNHGFTLPSTGSYTFSAWFRWWSSGAGNNGATSYQNGFCSDTATGVDQSADKVGVWQRVSNTITATSTSGTFFLISFGGTYGGSNSTWDVTMPMIQSGGSMVGDWINGANGDAGIDTSSSGNSVIKTTNVTWNSNYGGAFSLNGTNSYLDYNTYFSQLSGNNPWTVEVWYKKTAGAYVELFGNYGSSYSSGIWVFTGGVYIQGSVYEASSYADNTVYQIVVSRDTNGFVKVFRNVVLTQTGQLTGTVPENINYRIGSDVNVSGESLTGEIYIVRVYSRVLNSYEIAENFQSTRGRFGI